MCGLPMPSWKRRRAARRFAWPICWSFENGWIVIRPRRWVSIMCKENFAASVTRNMPHMDAGKQECLLCSTCNMVVYADYAPISPSITLLTPGLERRIYNYILISEEPDAYAPEGRCQDRGTGPQRNAQPAPRSDRRSAVPEQPFLRSEEHT